jgi:hypothetical protein
MPRYVKRVLCQLIKGSHRARTSHSTSTYMCEHKHNHGKPKWKSPWDVKFFTCQKIMSVINDY